MQQVSEFRIRACNEAPPNPQGDFVLYWMTANRRTRWNFSLQHAVEWSVKLGKPLVVLEALRCGYRWASDRLHAFILQGMRDNAEDFAESAILYYPYLEPKAGAGKGLLKALGAHACCVVTDDFPCFFLPRMVASAARQVPVLLEAVDSKRYCCVTLERQGFLTAYSFRRFLQKTSIPIFTRFRNAIRPVKLRRRDGNISRTTYSINGPRRTVNCRTSTGSPSRPFPSITRWDRLPSPEALGLPRKGSRPFWIRLCGTMPNRVTTRMPIARAVFLPICISAIFLCIRSLPRSWNEKTGR
jgi:hypothetical protein